jgi:hypothetical protein
MAELHLVILANASPSFGCHYDAHCHLLSPGVALEKDSKPPALSFGSYASYFAAARSLSIAARMGTRVRDLSSGLEYAQAHIC